MKKSFYIADRLVGQNTRPFIIAEMSGNHNQSIERAFELVDAAAEAGVDAVKLQTYTADTMTLNLDQDEFSIKDEGSLWNNESLYQLYEKAHTPWEWHKPIFDRCQEKGLLAFSSPFDASAVDFLESLNVPCYKIASFENTDIPLIQKVAATGKPMIMSTGMATEAELRESIAAAREAGCEDLVILKCTSTYPASPKNTNIRTISDMRERFDTLVGLSDHTMGVGVAVASVSLGAVVIEKHFTLRRDDGGVDAAFSLEPDELKSLVVETTRAFEAQGTIHYGPTESEKASLQFRRSLYVCEDMKEGEVFSEKNLRAIRPGLGLPPKFLPKIIGKKITKGASKGTPVKWELVRQ